MRGHRILAAAFGTAFLVFVTASPALAAQVKVFGNMDGQQEVPAGDPDGSGAIVMTVRANAGKVCVDIGWANVDQTTALHIHNAAAGVNGPIVIQLEPVRTGTARCITGLAPTLLSDIKMNPQNYYCNLHTAAFPGGAIRGQLQLSS